MKWAQKEKVHDKHMLCHFCAEIKALGECVFDVTICNMALMDMPTIQPLLAGLHCVLKVQILEVDSALPSSAQQETVIYCSYMPHVCLLKLQCF